MHILVLGFCYWFHIPAVLLSVMRLHETILKINAFLLLSVVGVRRHEDASYCSPWRQSRAVTTGRGSLKCSGITTRTDLGLNPARVSALPPEPSASELAHIAHRRGTAQLTLGPQHFRHVGHNWESRKSGFDSWKGQDRFWSPPSLLSNGVPGREADHSPSPTGVVKDERSYTSTPPYNLKPLCLIN
jgi:hypothetical protein